MRSTNPAEIIEISDSDTDAGVSGRETGPLARAFETQSVALASDSILVIESSDSDDSGNLDNWSDSNNKLLEHLDLNSEPAVSGTPSKSSTQSHPTHVLAVTEANSTISLSSSDDEPSPGPLAAQKENTKDKTASTSKESLSFSAATQGRDKRPSLRKPIARPAKVVSTQTRDLNKVDAKLHRDVNKLVTDKKATIKEFTVEIS
ncbi:hypothetical protein FRC06_009584, partial [Ceratobasidium sp. 370]